MNYLTFSLLAIFIFIGLYFLVYFFYTFFYLLLPMFFWGAFFAKTDNDSADKIIKLAEIKPGQVAVDLGSGDGKLVIMLAKAGAVAFGFEINPFLVWLSRRKIKKAGLSQKAFVFCKNFWKEDLSKFDVVTIFGIKFIMKGLEAKLNKELRPGSKVISKYFVFPNWKPIKTLGQVNLYKK
jgi:SAM-dependent methyltransferase